MSCLIAASIDKDLSVSDQYTCRDLRALTVYHHALFLRSPVAGLSLLIASKIKDVFGRYCIKFWNVPSMPTNLYIPSPWLL